MVNQVFNLGTIFRRQTVTGRIRNVQHRSTGFNNSFYHTCQIFIIRTACIFCIKFHIIHKTTRIFYSSYRTFDNFFTVRIEFVFDMRIRSSDTCMNPFVLSKLQCVYSYINILLNSTGQGTNSRPGHRFRNLNHRIKITRTWNWESCFNHVYSQSFQCLRNLNLFYCIQLTSRNLFTIAKGGIKNK